jgi:hypothetical protein
MLELTINTVEVNSRRRMKKKSKIVTNVFAQKESQMCLQIWNEERGADLE